MEDRVKMARVLFVDDDPLALTVFAKAAEIFGHQAILAHSGAEAMQMATEQHPDIIFVDLLLADMDGLIVIRNLCANAVTGAIPVIMLSAGPELDAKQAALDAGAMAFLHKPVQLQVLQDVINRYTSGKSRSPAPDIHSPG